VAIDASEHGVDDGGQQARDSMPPLLLVAAVDKLTSRPERLTRLPRDSNPELQGQNLLCYRLHTGYLR
jgi:hypothetical protein